MPEYFEFEVSLSEVRPKIWRRFLIRSDATFMELHDAIQRACGWGSGHLWLFQEENGGEVVAESPESDPRERGPDARKVKLSSFFGAHGAPQCDYVYDFGDCWEHAVRLVRTVELLEEFHRRLLDGKRAFPPEDCGGVQGYRDCIRAAKGGKDPEGLREWLDGWDPEKWDLNCRKRTFDLDQPPKVLF